jgi:polysaccharide deacetylase 2 family uncharacterized protein YibQ
LDWVKNKPASSKKPQKKSVSSGSGKRKGKMTLEDGVKGILVAGVVLCAVVLAAGGFFLFRSFFFGGFAPPDSGTAESSGAPAVTEAAPAEDAPVPAEIPNGAPDGTAAAGSGAELLPELDEFLKSLEAGQAGTPALSAGIASVPVQPPILPADRKGILIFVIDDAGNNLRELEGFLSFPGPLTVAVLPGLPYSAEAAKRIRAAGKEVFLHQPMEPLGSQDPGPGAVKTGMSPAEVKSIVEKNLAELWPVAGLNNHEGSRATMDIEIMRAVLELCRDKHIVFLDSKTIADTASPAVSKELVFPIAQRDIFLDNEQDRDSIIRQIQAGCKKSEEKGYAIMIGHAWSPKLAAILTELYPGLVRQGYFLTTVSAILDPGK